jgi:hypothetical protein
MEDAMYLEPDKCAQCGRNLADSAKHSPHNTDLDGFAHRVFIRPLFCSPHCIDAAAETYVSLKKDAEELQYIENVKLIIDHNNEQRIKEDLRKHEERRIRMLLFDGKQKFFAAYSDARDKYENLPRPVQEPPRTRITSETRSDHTHLIGPTGSGKTTIIQQLVLNDLSDANPPAIIVIDPKGFMVENIAKLKCFAEHLQDRLIIIDATREPAPPLNLFPKNIDEIAISYAINNFDYLFAQAGSELTPMMRPVFRFCARLMFSLPNPDILMFMDLLESRPNDPRFQPSIDQLTDMGAKRFFAKDFYSDTYKTTRDQVKRRFNDILSMPSVCAAFTSTAPPLDMGKCLRERKVVLVHTGFSNGLIESQLIGRHMINLTLGAAFARGRTGDQAFIFIDEFQDYVDEDATPRHLRLAREYKLGMLCAHQNMYCAEMTENICAAISGNTNLKFCSNVSGADRTYMLRDMGCDPEFLDDHFNDKERKRVKFAARLPGSPAFSIGLPYPNIRPDMQMTDSQYAELLRRNSRNLCPSQPSNVKPAPPPPSAQPAPPRATQPAPAPPPPTPNHSSQLRDRTGALDWEVTISPRIAEAGGEIPLVVQRSGQPVKINIKIPALTKNNTVFRLVGMGHFRPDKTRGDLYLTIKVPGYPEQNTDWADKW